MQNTVQGKIHSFETCGTVDGPGLRFVLFMQGCEYRCLYCHNPDTWKMKDYQKLMTPREVVDKIVGLQSFYKNGGVTVSGGEPLLQPEFLTEFFRLCKENGLHTALDTAGSVWSEEIEAMLDCVDLVLLDIKTPDPVMHKRLTGKDLQPNLDFLEHLRDLGKATWIRYVLVPGYTDAAEDVGKLAELVLENPQVERVEILPYHNMAVSKYEALGMKYVLEELPPATSKQVDAAKKILAEKGIEVYG